MKTLVTLLALCLLAASALYARERHQRLTSDTELAERTELLRAAEREAEHARAAAHTAHGAYLDATAALEEARTTAAREIERHRQEATTAQAAATAAGQSLDATLDSLEATAPQELVPVVQAARVQAHWERAAHEALVRSLRGQVQQTETVLAESLSTLGAATRRGDAYALQVRGLETRIAAERELREYWERRRDPGLLDRARGNVQLAGVSFGLGGLLGGLAGYLIWR